MVIYSLFIIYFVNLGDVAGSLFRRDLLLAIPVALTAGIGVYYLFSYFGRTGRIQVIAFTSIVSVILAYIWFFKLDGSKWWPVNLQTLTTNFNILDAVVCFSPWLILLLLLKVGRKFLDQHRIEKKILTVILIVIILFSTLTPIVILVQAAKSTNNWNPTFYDQYNSIKSNGDNWWMPVLDFYSSTLRGDNFTTIGFGVTGLQYFLNRTFIDLINSKLA